MGQPMYPFFPPSIHPSTARCLLCLVVLHLVQPLDDGTEEVVHLEEGGRGVGAEAWGWGAEAWGWGWFWGWGWGWGWGRGWGRGWGGCRLAMLEAHFEDSEPSRLVQVEHAEVVLQRLVGGLVHVGQHEVEVELVVHLSTLE